MTTRLDTPLWSAVMRLNTDLSADLVRLSLATVTQSETPDGPCVRYAWPQFGLGIMLHGPGDIILTDDRTPEEDLLEYPADKFREAIDYHLEKLDARIRMNKVV